ncbi:hypothetical protein J5N97_011086 [Dioscorea zingiberensis]|uniref:Protein kinase domain-containing protein n=1 Tax=Dioscorea zingiberensis TaxID=325984 RepID=A0A9D5HND7_9LILI|nr:hypothetical protein J5N97_011086 [Dioscorea zingiberensis]
MYASQGITFFLVAINAASCLNRIGVIRSSTNADQTGHLIFSNGVLIESLCPTLGFALVVIPWFPLEHGQDDQPLNWNARMKIALGSARGLHTCTMTALLLYPWDIKSSNILLDISLEPHVSDFGLAKLLVGDDANVTTVVAGTFGYLAPEYLNDGRATEKSDVYSFGVLLLELVTGKRPTDPCFVRRGLNVVGWLNTLNGGDRLEEVIDEKCGNVGI